MAQQKFHIVRSFFRRLQTARFVAAARTCVFVMLSAGLLSSIASGQLPTVTALPYLLTDQAGVVTVITTGPVVKVPPAASLSGFGSLLGGGFGQLLTSSATAGSGPGAALAAAKVRSLLMIKKGNAMRKQLDNVNNDAQAAKENIENGNPQINDCLQNDDCTTAEEVESEDLDEELQILTQSENASQEAIESAEVAAENAATLAETAAESLEEGLEAVEVIDAMLEMLAAF